MSCIYPMAMTPKTNKIFKLYFLGFPPRWKELLLRLQLSVNPTFNTEYNLKTNVLYGYLMSWLDDVVKINPMKKTSDDSCWLVSLKGPDAESICEILQIWSMSEYGEHKKRTPETEALIKELCEAAEPDTLRSFLRCEEVRLFDDNGHALTDYAFDAFAIYAANALLGKTITISGHELTLCSCGSKKLMSRPVSDEKKNPCYFSIAVEMSVQTTPPERKCILPVVCSVRRFISNANRENIYLGENIHAYVSGNKNKYRSITMLQSANKDEESGKYLYKHFWSKPEQRCYDLYYTDSLPTAEDVLFSPETFIKASSGTQILLPYKNGMSFTYTNIGTGVPIVDKAEIFPQIAEYMKDFAAPLAEVESVDKSLSVRLTKEKDKAMNRQRLRDCVDLSQITIEIYGHRTDGELIGLIKNEIEEYFGGEEYGSVIPIEIKECELGELGGLMRSDKYEENRRRIEKVRGIIPASSDIVGALVILPPDLREEAGDPKAALRAGFADTNRLTQFIFSHKKDGEKDDPKMRARGAVMDLFRQFGYTCFNETRNTEKSPAFDADVIGLGVLSQLRPLWAGASKEAKYTAKHLPIYITYNVRSGKMAVNCDIPGFYHLSYPQALLKLSALSRQEDFVRLCNSAAQGGFRSKLIGISQLYRNASAMILTEANGTSRQLWNGLTDKTIGQYEYLEQYIPSKIETGTKTYSDMRSFCGTGVRIMRVRTQEIPDYYTPQKDEENYRSASGMFEYEKVFWGIEPRPNNKDYTLSFKNSRFDNPSKSYDECRPVEYYPIQLQPGDDARTWAAFTNYLRMVMVQTSRDSVVLPAPLHQIGLMKEYLLLAKKK